MKKHTSVTYIERCYLCPFLSMNSVEEEHEIVRAWTCMKLEKFIDKASLIKTSRKYKLAPIHQDGWFPTWCPLEDVNND